MSEMPKGTFAAPQNFPHPHPHHQRTEHRRADDGVQRELQHPRDTTLCPRTGSRFLPGAGQRDGEELLANTLIKQGAKLVGSWEDVSDDLLSQVHLPLEQEAGHESISVATASVLVNPVQRSDESIGSKALRADESLEFHELLEKLETQLTSCEVFTALFELELSGRIRCPPGKNNVRNLSL